MPEKNILIKEKSVRANVSEVRCKHKYRALQFPYLQIRVKLVVLNVAKHLYLHLDPCQSPSPTSFPSGKMRDPGNEVAPSRHSVKISHPNKRDAKGIFLTLSLQKKKNWQKTEASNSANFTRITSQATQTYDL